MTDIQGGWRSCPKCQGMHFAGFPGFKGVCPTGGQHEQTNSFAYAMEFDSANGNNTQTGWASCPKCQGMHFAGFPDFKGVCPAGGQHEQTNSFAYAMAHDLPALPDSQTEWRACKKCQGLFFGPFGGQCPAGGQHDAAGSFNYVMRVQINSDLVNPSITVDTERLQTGGYIRISGEGFTPGGTVYLYVENLVRQKNPFSAGSYRANSEGKIMKGEAIYEAQCWPNQFDPAVIRAVDVTTGKSATGESSAFTC